MTSVSGFDDQQMDELVQLFRSEGLEQVRRLAELLFQLENPQPNTVEGTLAEAFRQAHNLKGSAALLGFERVARVTHRFEDLLGALKSGARDLSSSTIDLLLEALDVIRQAVEGSEAGDERLSSEEQKIFDGLGVWLDELTRESSDAPPVESAAAAPSEKPRQASGAAPAPALSTEGLIRVPVLALQRLTDQVDDLFEAQLQQATFGSELSRLDFHLQRLAGALGDLERHVAAGEGSVQLGEARGRVELLRQQVDAAAVRFERSSQGTTRRIRGTQEQLARLGLQPIASLEVALRRQVREVARATGKAVELSFSAGEHAVDRRVLEALREPLVHLVRNAVDHGIEDRETRQRSGKEPTGQVRVSARHLGEAVELILSDDGAGIDLDRIRDTLRRNGVSEEEISALDPSLLLDHVFGAGFSTRRDVSSVSGRGVGLDVVKHTLSRMGGDVQLSTEPGVGTAITMRLPLSMSTVRCLLLQQSDRIFAVPAANVRKVLLLRAPEVESVGGREVVPLLGEHVPVTDLHQLLGLAAPATKQKSVQQVVVMEVGDRRWGFRVEDVLEYVQLILKPLGDLLERVPVITGMALLQGGDLALVLHPGDLLRAASSRVPEVSAASTVAEPVRPGVVLVVDDSLATRSLEKSMLESAGYQVLTATDGYDALEVLGREPCDLVITDAQMPRMDGFELVRALKGHSQHGRLPIIMITSLGSEEDIARGLDSGADAYVVKKNLTQRELVTTIQQLL